MEKDQNINPEDQSEEITKARRPDLWDAHEARLKNGKAPQD